MKKITFLFLLAFTIGNAQNLINNASFDDGTGWTVVNHYEAANTLGSVTFSDGVATFNETVAGDWKHMGIYTSVVLEVGTYQFDMEMTYNEINDCWGEVYIGSVEPLQNQDYSGDQQVIKAYNAWDCPDVKTYDGLATASGCDSEANPGQFDITTAGTYYILFRTGGSTYGTSGIVIDNWTLTSTTPAPIAGFIATTSTTNLDAIFTNTSTNATSYEWNFGDNSPISTNENPTHTYAIDGVYTVTLTASNSEQSSEFSNTIYIGNLVNLISNGTMDDETGWTIVNHYEAANTIGSVTFSDGVATFNETVAGDWKHMGIYTSVDLNAGMYQFDMHMVYNEINDCWGEVYIGSVEPLQNQDYSGDQQVIKAYNAWDCPDVKTYDGLATASGCDTSENPGQFEITTSGTYYILFRTGGSTYGTSGVAIDNVTLYNITPLSNEEFTTSDLSVYPNPTTNGWNITSNNQIIKSIDVYDLVGKKVVTSNPNAISVNVDASKLPSGIYITKIATDSGSVSLKLVKQ
jgi:PKD repeat protein